MRRHKYEITKTEKNRLLVDVDSRLQVLWCRVPELNQRHGDFQSPALPTELTRHIGELDAIEKIVGIEPTTHCLTDNCSTK